MDPGDEAVSTTVMAGPTAGWYHDPADDRAWRWWDGATWTGHVRAKEEPVAEVVADPPVAEPAASPAPPAPALASVGGSIPQPGEVAPPPPAPAVAGNVSTTPPIPVTDQMYWHSSAAEVIDVPRVSHVRGPSRPAAAVPSYVRDWNDLGSPETPGVWLLAFSPILGWVVAFAVLEAMSVAGIPPLIGVGIAALAALLLHWVFAALDTRALEARGYHAPRLAWMLLFPPLAYLIARGKSVRRESKRAWVPELVYIISHVLVAGLVFVLPVWVMVVLASLGVTI